MTVATEMRSAHMHSTKNGLPLEKRQVIVEVLNDRLADAIELSLHAKQAHWNVKGPSFIALHELFDKVYAAAQEYVDLIAERVVMLGGVAEGTLSAVASRTSLTAYPTGIVSGLEHADALATSLASFANLTRSDIDRMTELGDAITADLLTEVTRGADQYVWFVEAHLQSKQ